MARRHRVAVMLAMVPFYILLAALASAQPRLAERFVPAFGPEDGALFVHAGITQSHFRFVVAMLARSARVPIGFEEVAQEPEKHDGNLAKVRPEDRTNLIGLTVGRALDLLVAADARYAWREHDGVLLIRPINAWRDSNHFLHQLVGPIDAKHQRAIDIVKGFYDRHRLPVTWSAAGTIGDPPFFQDDLNRLISVLLPTATMLDGLNAIIRSHGQLGWLIEYARGPAQLRNGCIRLITFDGKVVGIGSIACPAGY
jgi:hypothetical protein